MTDDERINQLNADVTAAILEAERHTHLAARAWRKVAQIEGDISREERDAVLRGIGERGVWTASLKARVLEALDRYRDDRSAGG